MIQHNRRKSGRLQSRLPHLSLIALAVAGFSQAHAAQFSLGDFNLRVDSQISVGSSWRMEDRNNDYIANGTLAATGVTPGAQIIPGVYNPSYQGGNSSNTDNGNMNFDKGDAFSQVITGSHSIGLTHSQYRNYGANLSFRYWYDHVLSDLDGAPANAGMINDWKGTTAFDDAKSGIELMDAYVWGDFDVAGRPAQLMFGRHVLNWGESTFIQGGQNVANPIDVQALRRPGAELRDALLPVAMLSGSISLDDAGAFTLQGYYQFEWQRTRADACGTYFANADFAAEGCGPVYFSSAATEEVNAANPITTARRASDNEPSDTGQYGIALKWYAEQLNGTEFGFYYQNVHSRLPLVGGILPDIPAFDAGMGPGSGQAVYYATGGTPTEYRVEFPEDQKVFGLSFATLLPTGTAWSGEFTYRPDAAIQINANDVLARGLAANLGINNSADAAAAIASGNASLAQAGVAYLMLPSEAQALGAGEQKGYREFDVFQFQSTFIHDINRVLAADNLRIIGEVGFTYVNDLPDTSEMRFGRSSIYGSFGEYVPTLNPSQLATDLATSVLTGTPAAILGSVHANNGYVTDFSWGYRLAAQLEYTNALISGLTLKPTLSWSHDVKGYGPEPGSQFYEGRMILGLALGAEYRNTYFGNLSYTNYFDTDYWDLDDRDFISLSVGMNY